MCGEWKFKEPKNQAVYSLRRIIDSNEPILHVSHNSDDGAWQFLGWETPRVEDGVKVCLEHVVAKDPSIIELADLPLGWHAWRVSPSEPWTRELNPHDTKDGDG